MAERFSDIEKPFVIHQPSSLRNRKPRSTACSPLSRTPAGMWRKRPNPRDGLSRNCARRETKFSQLGPPSAAEEGSGMQRQAGGVNRKEKTSTGDPTGKNRNRREDLHPRSWRAADSTLCGIGASGVPWVFGSPAASHDRFWCR